MAAVIAGITAAQPQTKWDHKGNIYVPVREYMDRWFCYFVISVLPPTLLLLSLETSVGLGFSLVCCFVCLFGLFFCCCLLKHSSGSEAIVPLPLVIQINWCKVISALSK